MVKVGDRVRVTKGAFSFFTVGTEAVVVEIDKDGDAWGDFNQRCNASGTYDPDCDGIWCLERDGFDVIASQQ